MTVEQVKEAIRQRAPISIKLLFGEKIEYTRALCILPPHEGFTEPLVVLEDRSGHSITKCGISQIIGGDPYKAEERTPEAACE